MKLTRILGLLAVLLVLPITLALKDGQVRATVATAECQATVGDCCFSWGDICVKGGPVPIPNYLWYEDGCPSP